MPAIQAVRNSSLQSIRQILTYENAPIVCYKSEWYSEENLLVAWMEARVRGEIDMLIDWKPIILKICGVEQDEKANTK